MNPTCATEFEGAQKRIRTKECKTPAMSPLVAIPLTPCSLTRAGKGDPTRRAGHPPEGTQRKRPPATPAPGPWKASIRLRSSRSPRRRRCRPLLRCSRTCTLCFAEALRRECVVSCTRKQANADRTTPPNRFCRDEVHKKEERHRERGYSTNPRGTAIFISSRGVKKTREAGATAREENIIFVSRALLESLTRVSRNMQSVTALGNVGDSYLWW